ncbi:unnamed protein product [Amaranthus hypochondriacus]
MNVSREELPKPMDGLHQAGPPPFLTKTYDLVEETSTNNIISWSKGNNSFIVWDPQSFSINLLPKYFKHNNFSSFVRQLNTYGFRKVDPDKWEFANELFLKGQKHLLKNIRRRKATSQNIAPTQNLESSCLELGTFGLDAEIDRLRRDKQVLMAELVKLRQHQQNTKSYLQLMELKLKGTEQKQQQMMNFLARAIQSPDFLHQLVHKKERRKELVEAISKKRRRPIEQGPTSTCSTVFTVKEEPFDFNDVPEFEDSSLDLLRMEMQGPIEDNIINVPQFEDSNLDVLGMEMQRSSEEDIVNVPKFEDSNLDVLGMDKSEDLLIEGYEEMGRSLEISTLDGFWDDLLENKIEEDQGGLLNVNDEESLEEEDVDLLVERLGELGSKPPY